jgi:hypothetical protein
MRIYNLKHFITAVTCVVLSIILLCISFWGEFNLKYIIGALLLIVLAIVDFIFSLKKDDNKAEKASLADERDRYVVMKSGRKTLQITNWILGGLITICVVLYGITRQKAFIVASMVFCLVILIMFVVLLIVNTYYEKHE